MNDYNTDVLIVGGGLIGGLLAITLESFNINYLLIDKIDLYNTKANDFDARSLALSTSSIRILKNLNIWPIIEKYATVIDKIHVSERGAFGSSIFEDDLLEPLGYIIEIQQLNQAIHNLINFKKVISNATLTNINIDENVVTIQTPKQPLTIKAKLIIAADGSNSPIRTMCKLAHNINDFNQYALVTNIGLMRDHKNIAYERFTKNGPIAMLPMQNLRSSLVWSLPIDKESYYLNLSDNDFLKELQLVFGYRLGKFIKVGKRSIYPLKQIIMPSTTINSLVFIGNAAHTLHPVAGQGFNLGLRDIAALSQCIIKYGLSDKTLDEYQKLRKHDQFAIKQLTEIFASVFTKKIPGLFLARGLSLIALDNNFYFKNLLISYMRGFAGIASDLVCNIKTKQEDLIN